MYIKKLTFIDTDIAIFFSVPVFEIFSKSGPGLSYSSVNTYNLNISCSDGIDTSYRTFVVYILQNVAPSFTNLPSKYIYIIFITANMKSSSCICQLYFLFLYFWNPWHLHVFSRTCQLSVRLILYGFADNTCHWYMDTCHHRFNNDICQVHANWNSSVCCSVHRSRQPWFVDQ